MHCGYTTWGHAQCGRVWHYLCLHMSCVLQHSMAGHQRTVGIPAGGGRADTPAGGGQVGIPAGATLRVGMHAHAMGEEGAEEEAVPWELGNIKFQLG